MRINLKDLRRGEIFKEEVKDSKGSEQKGYRPYLVVSDHSFNSLNGYVLVCPLSNKEYSEPDGIEVITKKSAISGWVLTQHLTPYFSNYIENNSSKVNVVDCAEDYIVEKCLEVFEAIASKTSLKHTGLSQGELIQIDLNNAPIFAVVLSENSFNLNHNSVWVAPIKVESSLDVEPDHVNIENKHVFGEDYGIVYVEAVRNIHAEARNLKRLNVSVSDSELTMCLDVLHVFFEKF